MPLPISIPTGFTPIVQESDVIQVGQVVARRDAHSSLEQIIPLAKLLGVSPKKTAKTLRKNPGDLLREGEILATKPGFITVIDVVSKVSGTVLRYERDQGSVIVQMNTLQTDGRDRSDEIQSPFGGTVLSVDDNQIVLDSKKGAIFATKGIGPAVQGVLMSVDKKQTDPIEGMDITVSMIGNIVLGTSFSREALVKASGMGIGGIVALQLSDEDISHLEQKRMVIPVVAVDEKNWQLLMKSLGKQAFVDPVEKTILIA